MRKFTVLAALAAVLIAAPMFAVERHLTLAPNATFAPGTGAAGGPTSTNNNDTCDIGDAPAATLLLPYFNVDFNGNTANTVFTIVNTSRFPQIAHVVLWTDWSFAALDFNIFLTGYDVQSISLRDIFANGQIAPTPTGTTGGTSATGSINGPGSTTNPTLATVQTRNVANGAAGGVPQLNCTSGCSGTGATGITNPNFTSAVGGTALNGCLNLPGQIPSTLLSDLRTVFTTGSGGTIIGNTCSDRLGGTHTNAVGYVTIDVASNCSTNLPGPTYFSTDILFDNTLTGDYEQIVPGTSGGLTAASGGSPLVHIRAVPEGGPSGAAQVPTNLPYTFYDRYTVAPTATTPASAAAGIRTFDRRQPLPNTFAARWIQGGTGNFNSNFQIWREGVGSPAGFGTDCGAGIAAPDIPPANALLAITDEVRFDEHENAVGVTVQSTVSPAQTASPQLPESSSTPTSSSLPFPPAVPNSTDVSGWMYLNLANGGTGLADCRLTFTRGIGAGGVGFGPGNCQRTTTQNWVTTVMSAAPSFTAVFDATWLGNGCTPAPASGASIAPATQRPATGGANPSFLVCPPPLVIGTNCVPTASYQLSTPTP